MKHSTKMQLRTYQISKMARSSWQKCSCKWDRVTTAFVTYTKSSWFRKKSYAKKRCFFYKQSLFYVLHPNHLTRYLTCIGLEFGARGLMMRLVPIVYSIPSESGAHAAPYTGTETCASVDRSMPLRDQIFTKPSSPAAMVIQEWRSSWICECDVERIQKPNN